MKYSLNLIFLSLLLFTGCNQAPQKQPEQNAKNNVVYAAYAPVKIEIIPLTEVIKDDKGLKIKPYISLLDKFDSQIKYPAVFRFELYQKIQYSAQPRGKRIYIWPDINLADAVKNNNYWIDTFRAYKFDLDFEIQPNINYMLQLTCILPGGKRLETEFVL